MDSLSVKALLAANNKEKVENVKEGTFSKYHVYSITYQCQNWVAPV